MNFKILCDFRFGADFLNIHGAVIPRVTSNAAFHNIFWSVTLHQADVSERAIRHSVSNITFCPKIKIVVMLEKNHEGLF